MTASLISWSSFSKIKTVYGLDNEFGSVVCYTINIEHCAALFTVIGFLIQNSCKKIGSAVEVPSFIKCHSITCAISLF